MSCTGYREPSPLTFHLLSLRGLGRLRALIRSEAVREHTAALIGLAGIYDLSTLVEECQCLFLLQLLLRIAD